MIEPSPRPWYRDHIYYITDPNRRDVANTYFSYHQHDVDEANARLIVRAVNAYDSLLAACKAVEALLDQGLALGMSVEDVKVAYDILHADIKKAEADDE